MLTAHTACKGGNDWCQICRIGPGKFRTGPSFQDRSCMARIDPAKTRPDPDKIRTDHDHAGPVRGSQTRFCPFLTVILNHRCPPIFLRKVVRFNLRRQNNETVQRGLRRGSNSLVLFLHNRPSISDMLVYYCCRKVWHVGSHAESPVAFACAWRANFDMFA